MSDKYSLYRALYPVRVTRQNALREARLDVSLHEFQSAIGPGHLRRLAAAYLWERLRELAFVADFRPSVSDDLGEVYALSPESVRDDVVSGLVDHVGLQTEHIDFTGFSFSALNSPQQIVDFVERLAALHGQPAGTRFV